MRRFVPSLVVLSLVAVALASSPQAATAAPARAKGSYIVQLRPGVSPTAAAAVARRHGGRAAFVYDAALDGFAFSGPDGALAALRADPQVASVEPDYVARIADSPDAPADHLAVTDSNKARNSGYTGTSALQTSLIAVLDTGVQPNHPVFLSHSNVISQGFGGCVGASTAKDLNGHGTAVAGNAVGRDGVAHEAHVLGVKVIPGSGESTTWSKVICGLNYVRKYNKSHPLEADDIDVVNISIAGPGSATLQTAVENVIASGVVVVAAAGNDAGAVQSPANYRGVLSASALNHNGTAFASFSARHAVMAAPGVHIYGPDKNSTYSYRTGTSRSAPQLSGGAAVVLALNPDAKLAIKILKQSGRCANGNQRGATACGSTWTGSGGSKEPLLDTYCAAIMADTTPTATDPDCLDTVS